MRYTSIPVYTFDELNEHAKEKAKIEYASLFGYDFADDAIASLKALAEHFGARLRDYSIDFFAASYSYVEFVAPEIDDKELAALVETLGDGSGHCVLTGYCADEDAIDGVRDAYQNGERDIDKLLQAGFRTWLRACHADCEYLYSDEAFSELCEVNGWEFEEDGSFFRHAGKVAA